MYIREVKSGKKFAIGTAEMPGAIWIPRKCKLSSKVWSPSVGWIKKEEEVGGRYVPNERQKELWEMQNRLRKNMK